MNHKDHTTCEIHLDNNPKKVYYSGQLLSGRVALTFCKEKTVREIFVTIFGKAYCHWRFTREYKDCHTGEERHLHEQIHIVGGQNGNITIPPGAYNYPFSYKLPKDLPSSVEGDKGHIRYTIAVCIVRPMQSDQIFEESLTVIKPLNLNEEPTMIRYPFIKEQIKVFSHCFLYCWGTDPIYISVKTPATGYTPGQTIELSLRFDNKSNRTFRYFEVQLVKHIHYLAKTGSACETIVLVEQLCDGCPKRQSVDHKVYVTVPDVPPSDESSCKIIKVSYRLRIQGSSVFCDYFDVHFPITIGTHPFLTSSIKNENSTITKQPSLLAILPVSGYSFTSPNVSS